MSHNGFAGRQRLVLEAIIAPSPATSSSLIGPTPLASADVPVHQGLAARSAVLHLFGAFVIVGAGNSVNFTDGLDGLAIVPVMVAAACFGLIAYLVGNADLLRLPADQLRARHRRTLGRLCGALIGAGLGFLWFNAPPAQIFMGDTGSLALGGASARSRSRPSTRSCSPSSAGCSCSRPSR